MFRDVSRACVGVLSAASKPLAEVGVTIEIAVTQIPPSCVTITENVRSRARYPQTKNQGCGWDVPAMDAVDKPTRLTRARLMTIVLCILTV